MVFGQPRQIETLFTKTKAEGFPSSNSHKILRLYNYELAMMFFRY